MGRFIVEFLFPVAWVTYTVWITLAWWRLKKRLDRLHNPELCLTRKERRTRARQILQRQDDEANQKLFEHNMDYLKGGKLEQ